MNLISQARVNANKSSHAMKVTPNSEVVLSTYRDFQELLVIYDVTLLINLKFEVFCYCKTLELKSLSEECKQLPRFCRNEGK